MRFMAPDLTWVGPLSCQRTTTADDMRSMLEPEYDTPVEMFDESWGIRSMGDVRIVTGTFSARAPESHAADLAFLQTATFVWGMAPDGPLVVHLHLSNAYDIPSSLTRPAAPDEDGVEYVIDATAPPAVPRDRLRFEAPGGGVIYIAEDRILCLDAAENGCMVVCEGRSFSERDRLSHMENRLPVDFVQIHRSCIVNAKRVAAIRRFEVVLDDGSIRPVAERRYLEIVEAVEEVAGRMLREG